MDLGSREIPDPRERWMLPDACPTLTTGSVTSWTDTPRIISRIDVRSPHKGAASEMAHSRRQLESNPRSDLNYPGAGIAVLAENAAEVRIASVRINTGEIHAIDNIKKLELQL